MARNITVTFADGSTAEYRNAPDDVTPEQVTERAQKEYGLQVTALDGGRSGGIGDAVARKAKVAGSAVARGVLGLPALAADAANAIAENLPIVGPTLRFARKEAGVPETNSMALSKGNAQLGAQPETTGEKYLASTLEGAAGALAGPGIATPIRSALSGVMAGAGAQAAGQLSGDNAAARLAGGLAGGLAGSGLAGLASRVRPQSADLAREALEGIDDATLQAAQQLQQRAKAESGVTMDLAQALEAVGAPQGNLTTIRNVLANSRHGSGVQAVLRQQPKDLEFAADTTIAGLPGPQWGQAAAANAVQEAATGAVNSAKASRSAQVQQMYKQAGALPEGGREKLLNAVQELVDRPGNTDAFNRAAMELKGKLSGEVGPEAERLSAALQALRDAPRGKAKALAAVEVRKATEAMRGVSQQPLQALDVDTAISDAVGPFRGTPLSPVDPKSAGQVKGLAGRMNQELQGLSPELRAAEERFAAISRETVDPLKQSVVGQLATPRGYKPDVQASIAKLEGIFSKGSDAQVAEAGRDIPRLFNELRAVDPDAVPAAAKAFLRSRLDRSFGSLPGQTIPGAVTSPDAAKALRDSLFASRAQEQGMRDIAVGIARSYGMDENEMVRGLSHFMQVTKGLASRPDKVGGLNWGDVAKAGGKSSLADVARVYGFLPFERVARKIEDATLARTFQEFDRVLTTPEGADLLRTLARTPNMSDKAILAISQFGAVAPVTPGDSE